MARAARLRQDRRGCVGAFGGGTSGLRVVGEGVSIGRCGISKTLLDLADDD